MFPTIYNMWKQPKYLSIDEWIKRGYTYNETLFSSKISTTNTVTWMRLEDMMVSGNKPTKKRQHDLTI